MQHYLLQLLADIQSAQCPEEPRPRTYQQPRTVEDDFEEAEQWLLAEEPPHTFGYYCGLARVQFPPADRFTEEQLRQVNKAFGHLMFTWNLGTDLPDGAPPDKAYSLLVGTLDQKTVIVTDGFVGFEFCHYSGENCPFAPDFCACKERQDRYTATYYEGEEDDDETDEMALESGEDGPYTPYKGSGHPCDDDPEGGMELPY